jgi:hypothetical protein
VSTERIVTVSTWVADSIRLSSRLSPDESIDKRIVSGTGWSDTETSTNNVAPISPCGTETSDTVTSGINDGVVGHTSSLEKRSKGVYVSLLILALVVLGIGGGGELSWGLLECVPSGNVGRDTKDLLWRASGLVDLGETLGTRL